MSTNEQALAIEDQEFHQALISLKETFGFRYGCEEYAHVLIIHVITEILRGCPSRQEALQFIQLWVNTAIQAYDSMKENIDSDE